jgi:hypothetical protein
LAQGELFVLAQVVHVDVAIGLHPVFVGLDGERPDQAQAALGVGDAIGCQRDIAEAIRAKGADYLLALKDNWPTLADEVCLYFEREPARAFDCHQTTDGDHGRVEVRRHRVSTDVAWLASSRRFPGEPRFPDLAMIGMVEAEVERNGTASTARRYYLCSAKLSAAQLSDSYGREGR